MPKTRAAKPQDLRYTPPEAFRAFQERTGVDWAAAAAAFDPCPRGTTFVDARTYDWNCEHCYLNPPFSLLKLFTTYAVK